MSTKSKSEALELVRKNPSSILGTVDGDKPVLRAMWVARVDDDFTIWYATGLSSEKIRHIEKNPNVCITFSLGPSYMRVFGQAYKMVEDKYRDELWVDGWSHFFPGGKSDPEYALIKIIPDQIEYYDMERFGLKQIVML